MNKTVSDLVSQLYNLRKRARSLEEALLIIRETCNHNWKYDGHGHNSDSYVCIECGQEEEH